MLISVMTALILVLALQSYTMQQKPEDITSAKERAQGQDSRLDHVKLQLRTVGEDYHANNYKFRFSCDATVWVRILAINSDSKEVVLPYVGSFVHYLPKLSRDGKVLPYNMKMQKRIADNSRPLRAKGTFVKLPPNQLSRSAIINLLDWYDALEPGMYELKLKYRLYLSGPEVESDTVMFEVVP